MAHGAGGRATRSLVEGLLAPAFGIEALDDAAARRRARASPPTRSSSSRCASRAARSASWRSTAPSTTSRWAGAQPLALTLSPDPRGRPGRGRRCAPRSTRSRARPRRPACGSSAATRRSSSAATPTACTSRPPGSAGATRARSSSPPGPATGSCSPARSPRTAPRSCSRAASSTSTPTRSSPTRARCGPPSTRILGPGVRRLRDATRGGVASVLNELARDSGVAMLIQEAAVPVAPAVAGACELLGIDPMYVANEGVFVRDRRARPRVAGLRRHRRGQDRAARHGARQDELRRQAGDGRAGRRPAAEDLLMHELSIADAIVRIALRARGRARGSRASRSRSGTCARSCPTRWSSRSPSSPRAPRPRARS